MSESSKKRAIVAFIDAPDPDNFVQLLALYRLNPAAEIHVALTGRPVRLGADRSKQTWEWLEKDSRLAQEASAMRAKNFLRHFGIKVVNVYDGGIAPRTLIPHWIHFAEYYKFRDVDPLQAIAHSELEPQEDLIKAMLKFEPGSIDIAIGGPMTGLYQVIQRNPDVISRIHEVHAMFATWGKTALMQLDDKPRGALQFNAYCDPQAANFVLMGLKCPIYLMPSEVTRVKEIGFVNAQALREFLPENDGTRALYTLYALWYDAAVRPRLEKNPDEQIFIHDLVAAYSLDKALREGIYKVSPVKVTSVPYLPSEAADWGKVIMQVTTEPTNIYAATELTEKGPELYLKTLKEICSMKEICS